MEEIKVLKAKRGQVKAAVTRFKNFLSSFTPGEGSVTEIKARKDKFLQTWEQFNELQASIELLDSAEAGETERDDFENNYFELLTISEDLIVQSESRNPPKRHANLEGLKLPVIELKTFSGNYEEWHSYCQLFTSMIHENACLNEIQKFHYLRSSLTGGAAEVISSLEITAQNYLEAWGLLKERYDNRRLIIHMHLRALFEASAVPKENFVALRKLLDHIKKHLRALKALNSDAIAGNDLLVYLILTKLDPITVKEWEGMWTKESKPTFNDLLEMLTQKCDVLEAVKPPQGSKISTQNHKRLYQGGVSAVALPTAADSKEEEEHQVVGYGMAHKSSSSAGNATDESCIFCKRHHKVYKCEKFKGLTPSEKYKFVMKSGLCLNCLKPGIHIAKTCVAPSCRICAKKHNTLLHTSFQAVKGKSIQPEHNVESEDNKDNKTSSNCNISYGKQAILSTAVVKVLDSHGKAHEARALLDSGSQSDFITERLAKVLNLNPERVNVSIVGIGQQTVGTLKRVKLSLGSRLNEYLVDIQPYVMGQITEALPMDSFEKDKIKIPADLVMADPNFNLTGEIDLLLGVQIFWDCMLNERLIVRNQPSLQNTKFGWVLAGGWNADVHSTKHFNCNTAIIDDVGINLNKFWEIENVETKFEFNPEDRYCLEHFQNATKRDETGRFTVELPIKEEKLGLLGNNRENALRRFFALEKRLEKLPELKGEYVNFMKEYEMLGHMREITETQVSNSCTPAFYIPHHCVINEKSETTRLRVVFDASCKSQTGLSLNDILMTGPVLQDDLFSILLHFRMFTYVITADIKKMFRQVRIASHQTSLQRIFWRERPTDRMRIFELLTLTYGTAPASFLAINSIRELATKEASNFPLGAKIVLRDFYVDDMITGANSKEELRMIITEVVSLLKLGGFELAKWSGNLDELSDKPENVGFDKSRTSRALGVMWEPKTDEFGYTMPKEIESDIISKRMILGTIAQIFDPLGLIGPFVITAKMLLRTIWRLQLDWDQRVPDDIQNCWKSFLAETKFLAEVRTFRNVTKGAEGSKKIALHGFCDASEEAYGACLYIRTADLNGKIQTSLLCAKSRVAPIKAITLPRLELCAAQLLAALIVKTRHSLGLNLHDIYCWTDSKIVLAWLRARNKRWSVFVAHRVGFIQEYTATDQWNHVKSEDNPADIISRGIKLSKLIHNELWWKGPSWLSADMENYPEYQDELEIDDIPEQKKMLVGCVTEEAFNLFERYGTFRKLVRVTAYLKRFIFNCRNNKNNRELEELSSRNLIQAEETLLKIIQNEAFGEDIKNLKKNGRTTGSSRLLCLHPFLDDRKILRVGGRLQNADLPFETKHQIILPSRHKFTKLLFIQEHERLLHAGVQTTLASIRRKFWPIAGKSALREVIRNCMICRKAEPIPAKHLMGSLPKERTIACRPFSHTGVDYCGPFMIKEGPRKNSKYFKAYVAIFVCLSYKAVHLEIASDLSTEAFVKALKRVTGRRGKIQKLISDNATNFVGASRILKDIEWQFIPPRTPHFGGIWEAAVKRFKYHFRRIAKDCKYTYEQFHTLVIEIEAVLNSRPITPVSNDINDLSCLTPAHFLIGDSLCATPEKGVEIGTVNWRAQWDLIQRQRQHFWKRWSTEYLRDCQTRTKWKTDGEAIKEGQLVMVIMEYTPPMKWVLGRITGILRGADGVPRVVNVKTRDGEFKRGITRIAPLPCQ